MLKKVLLGAGVIAAAMSFATPANAATVVTFADPTVGNTGTPPPFLFTYTAAAGAGSAGASLSGGYTSAGANPDLTLNITGTLYTAASFTFPTLTTDGTLTADGLKFVGGGPISTITFFNSANVALLYIDFDAAFLTSNTVGAGDLSANVVDIRPAAGADIYLDPEDFAFSFANRTQSLAAAEAAADSGIGSNLVQATASLTSSATVVPEPGSMMLLGTGLFGLARVARRRFNLGAR